MNQHHHTYLFYLAFAPGPDRHPVDLPDGTRAWVRAELSPTTDLVDALGYAKCRAGETFMNTHNRDCCDKDLWSPLPSADHRTISH